MNDLLNRVLAAVFRRQHPTLCAALDFALQRGVPPAEIHAQLVRDAEALGGAPRTVAGVYAYLCDVDPDFRRAEAERAATRGKER
jgi:hypothetical protein